MSIYNIIEEAVQAIDERINSDECQTVMGDQVGLDRRAGLLYVFDDCIVSTTPDRVDYYGGFEYISKEEVTTIGRYKIYFREDGNRVDRAIETLNNELNEEEE